MIATLSSRRTPSSARPTENGRISSSTWDQVQVFQMPYSFSRMAGRSPRRTALINRSFGNVSTSDVVSAPKSRSLLNRPRRPIIRRLFLRGLFRASRFSMKHACGKGILDRQTGGLFATLAGSGARTAPLWGDLPILPAKRGRHWPKVERRLFAVAAELFQIEHRDPAVL